MYFSGVQKGYAFFGRVQIFEHFIKHRGNLVNFFNNSRKNVKIVFHGIVRDRYGSILGRFRAQKNDVSVRRMAGERSEHFDRILMRQSFGRPWSSGHEFFEIFSVTVLGVYSGYTGVYTPPLSYPHSGAYRYVPPLSYSVSHSRGYSR